MFLEVGVGRSSIEGVGMRVGTREWTAIIGRL